MLLIRPVENFVNTTYDCEIKPYARALIYVITTEVHLLDKGPIRLYLRFVKEDNLKPVQIYLTYLLSEATRFQSLQEAQQILITKKKLIFDSNVSFHKLKMDKTEFKQNLTIKCFMYERQESIREVEI